MQSCASGLRVTDGDRRGTVAYVIQGDRRGLNGGSLAECNIKWDNGESSFECVEDIELLNEEDEITTRLHRRR
jgi:hypothetical protein